MFSGFLSCLACWGFPLVSVAAVGAIQSYQQRSAVIPLVNIKLSGLLLITTEKHPHRVVLAGKSSKSTNPRGLRGRVGIL